MVLSKIWKFKLFEPADKRILRNKSISQWINFVIFEFSLTPVPCYGYYLRIPIPNVRSNRCFVEIPDSLISREPLVDRAIKIVGVWSKLPHDRVESRILHRKVAKSHIPHPVHNWEIYHSISRPKSLEYRPCWIQRRIFKKCLYKELT